MQVGLQLQRGGNPVPGSEDFSARNKKSRLGKEEVQYLEVRI